MIAGTWLIAVGSLAGWLAVADAGAPAAAPPAAATPVAAPSPDAAVAAGAAAASPSAPANRSGARADHALGLTLLREGKVEEAAAQFASAFERDPGNAGFATDLGFALGKLGRNAEAEAMLRAAIDKDPRRFYAYMNLADVLASDPGRWERRDAIVAFLEKGLEALRDDRKARFNVLLGLANFERSVARTGTARRRLEPLLAQEATPPLARAERKRVLDLLDAIALDERAYALEDWPAPPVTPADAAALEAAARAIDDGRAEAARTALDGLLARAPGWQRARLLRARALESLGRVDEAMRDLEIVVNLAPSNAEAWRALGRLLAANGGALETERADQALQNALALEPAWTDLRDLRAQLARRRPASSAPAPAARGADASDKARALYQEAEEWIDVGDPVGLGRDLLQKALADSPGFVAAAVAAYALSGSVPAATIEALQNDGPALWALASGVRKLGKDKEGAADALVRPWIDRAVALDVQEARFARALSRAAAGDRAGALDDLVAYVAREPRPEHLAEARALRAALAADPASRNGAAQLAPELLARIRLLEDKPDAALRALGGTCAPGMPVDRLAALGLVHEYADRRTAARACYELAAKEGQGQVPGEQRALVRLARLDARLPDAELGAADRRPLLRAAGRNVAAAEWALARIAAGDGDDVTALARAERAVALAGRSATSADVWLADARAARDRMAAATRADARARQDRRRWIALGAAALVAAVLAMLARRRWGGRSVAAALRRRPSLFPEVARAVGEIRHDVLKHRAGVLGMLAEPDAPRAEITRTMVEPRPVSAAVAAVYDRVGQVAGALQVRLRALDREPVFGALTRDLGRAEALLMLPQSGPTAEQPVVAELLAIDGRLRGEHADALEGLLQLGPRTRLDAAALATWIDAVEASARQAGGGWAAPALSLADLAVDFPVEHDALAAIFANLLRNAQAAVASDADPRVIVRVDRDRDVTGRQTVSLLVGDSAAASLTEEVIETRESGRGLGIVRDLVRQWRGQVVVRPETAPFSKNVGACFPL